MSLRLWAGGAEQRAERSKLKPADEQFAGQFLGHPESADVASPIRQSAQPGIDGYRNVHAQGVPIRMDVAGPDEIAVVLHTGKAVLEKRVGPLVGIVGPRAVPIKLHAAAVHTPIGPPAVD